MKPVKKEICNEILVQLTEPLINGMPNNMRYQIITEL